MMLGPYVCSSSAVAGVGVLYARPREARGLGTPGLKDVQHATLAVPRTRPDVTVETPALPQQGQGLHGSFSGVTHAGPSSCRAASSRKTGSSFVMLTRRRAEDHHLFHESLPLRTLWCVTVWRWKVPCQSRQSPRLCGRTCCERAWLLSVRAGVCGSSPRGGVLPPL